MEAPAPAPDASPADAPAPDLATRVAYLEARNRELETRAAAAEATPKLRDDATYAPFLAAHDAGAPKHVVAHRMTTAGLDARALSVDRDTPVSALEPQRRRLRDDVRRRAPARGGRAGRARGAHGPRRAHAARAAARRG